MTHFDQTLADLRAAGEETRLRTLLFLAQTELTVTELTGLLDQSQPRVSRHLKVLADAGLVERHQEAAWTFYRIAGASALERLGLTPTKAAGLLPENDRMALDRLRIRRSQGVADYFAAQAENWQALRRLLIDEAQVEAELMKLAPEPADLFLDLGTGTGRMLIAFRELYDRAVGIDLSPEMLALARTQLTEANVGHAHVRRADFLADDLVETASLICLHHVLHFMSDPDQALLAARRALTADGNILVADFAPHTHEELRETHAHRRLGFSEAEIERWAAAAGLTVTASTRLPPPHSGGLTTCIWRLSAPASKWCADHPTPTLFSSKADCHV